MTMSSSRTTSIPDRWPVTLAILVLVLTSAGHAASSPDQEFEFPDDGRWHAFPHPRQQGVALEFRSRPGWSSEIEVRFRDVGGKILDRQPLIYGRHHSFVPVTLVRPGPLQLRFRQRVRGQLVRVQSVSEWMPAGDSAWRSMEFSGFQGRRYSLLAGTENLRRRLARSRTALPEHADGDGNLGRSLRAVVLLQELMIEGDPLPRGFVLTDGRLGWGGGRFELHRWIEQNGHGVIDHHANFGFLFVDHARRYCELWTTGMHPNLGLPVVRLDVRDGRVYFENHELTSAGIELVDSWWPDGAATHEGLCPPDGSPCEHSDCLWSSAPRRLSGASPGRRYRIEYLHPTVDDTWVSRQVLVKDGVELAGEWAQRRADLIPPSRARRGPRGCPLPEPAELGWIGDRKDGSLFLIDRE